MFTSCLVAQGRQPVTFQAILNSFFLCLSQSIIWIDVYKYAHSKRLLVRHIYYISVITYAGDHVWVLWAFFAVKYL